jgi:peptidoglycan hydrolase-like protein with peptidoglycan-binding domain
MQARLNFFGYGAGPVTGEWSPLTRRALARWQIRAGLEPTGELDDDTVDRLKLDAPTS